MLPETAIATNNHSTGKPVNPVNWLLNTNTGKTTLSAIAQDGVELRIRARVTVRTNLEQLIGGATEETVIARPDIVIVEGLNVLQTAASDGENPLFVSDFFDFSIYLDADMGLIEHWYVERFMRLRKTAFRDPAAYFHQYALLSDEDARRKGQQIWQGINRKNLEENILPTKQRARLILRKSASHRIERVALRKL